MLHVLPVKVRSRELTVCPCSYIRHHFRVTWSGESSEVKALVSEGQASFQAVAISELYSLVTRPPELTDSGNCRSRTFAEVVKASADDEGTVICNHPKCRGTEGGMGV